MPADSPCSLAASKEGLKSAVKFTKFKRLELAGLVTRTRQIPFDVPEVFSVIIPDKTIRQGNREQR